MKLAGVVLGLVLVGVAGWYLIPGFLHRTPQATHGSLPAPGGTLPERAHPLEPPETREEEVRRRFTQERQPLFRFMRERFGSIIVGCAEGEDVDTLDVTLTRNDADTLQTVMTGVVLPYGREYGFRHVRFYIPSPPSSPDPRTLIAEAALSEQGRWTLFPK